MRPRLGSLSKPLFISDNRTARACAGRRMLSLPFFAQQSEPSLRPYSPEKIIAARIFCDVNQEFA